MARRRRASTPTWARCWRTSAGSCCEPLQGARMTTVVAVRKGGQVALMADTLVTFGDTRLSHRMEANQKAFMVEDAEGKSIFAAAGAAAHFLVLRHALAAQPREELRLGSKDDVFRTLMRLHPVLKEHFFLQ